MTFRDIEQGQVFTSFYSNKTRTAIKTDDKTAILLETGETVMIHHNDPRFTGERKRGRST